MGFHATLASVSFAGLIFLMRGTAVDDPTEANTPTYRQRALLALATALVLFITAAAEYSLATGYRELPVLAWILTAATAVCSICGALLLYFTVIMLFQAHGLTYATRISRWLFTFGWITLGAYLWIDLSAATATIAFAGVAIARTPGWFVAVSALAVIVPMSAAFVLLKSRRVRQFASTDHAFERMLRVVLSVGLGLPALALIAFAFETSYVDPALWLVLVVPAMIVIASVLAMTYVVLISLLHEEPLGHAAAG